MKMSKIHSYNLTGTENALVLSLKQFKLVSF